MPELNEINGEEQYREYNARMSKSMMDKIFFLDKIFNCGCFVDFGCADGTLLKFMRPYVENNIKLIGYDIDEKMIEVAKENCKNINIEFTKKWLDLDLANKTNKALILSSVIHEIYHYCAPQEIDNFWEKALGNNFEYVIIRDMCVSRNIDRPSNIDDIAKIYNQFLHKQELRDFESNFGSIENNRSLVHFLLKYKYTSPNWVREVKENYFPMYREDMLALLSKHNYEIVYHEHFTLPYLKHIVKNDFGIELKDPTHIKIILKRKC